MPGRPHVLLARAISDAYTKGINNYTDTIVETCKLTNDIMLQNITAFNGLIDYVSESAKKFLISSANIAGMFPEQPSRKVR